MTVLGDIRFALRTLAKQRLVTGLVVACLALVVAGNTAVFSVVRSYLIKPLPYEDVERLAIVLESERAVPDSELGLSIPTFRELRSRNRTLEGLAGLSETAVNLTGEGTPEELEVQLSTPGFLAMLGTRPALGRSFVEDDGRPGGGKVALLTDPLWKRRFAADPEAVGKSILLDREVYEIIGVLPEDFEYLSWTVDLWLPLVVDPSDQDRTRSLSHCVAKIRPGVSADTARAELLAIGRELEAELPEAERGHDVILRTFAEQFPGPTDRWLFSLIQGAGLFVLVIACANVANLLLARGQQRRRELALRAALGAGKRRMFRQLLTESVVLALSGGVLGIALGAALVRGLHQQLAGTLPKSILPEMDAWVLLFSLSISAGAGVLFGLVPSLQALRGDLNNALRQGGERGVGGGRGLALSLFVVAEVALALTLLCGSGLLLRTFLDVQYGDRASTVIGC